MSKSLSSLPAPAWQPIETAPKDGTRILIYDAAWCGGRPRYEVSYWQPYKVKEGPADEPYIVRGSWSGVTKATHWMPLPAAPLVPPTDDQKTKT